MLIRFFFHSDQQILLSSVENSYFLKSRCETVLLSLHTTLLKMLEHMYTTDSDEKDYPKYGISGSRKHFCEKCIELGNLHKELFLHFPSIFCLY